MTLPPYSRQREEELRRRIEEEERRRRQIKEELAQPVPEHQENQPDAATDALNGSTLESTMEQLRRKYFVRGVGIGGLVGAVGGTAFGYVMDRYQWNQLAKSIPQEAAFQYENTVVAGLLCLAFGASLGVLIGNAYGQRKARELEKRNLETEVSQ